MSTSCKAQVIVDASPGHVFTNLEHINGQVNLQVMKDMGVENIQIKLIGISTSRILRTIIDNKGKSRKVIREETHEVLYDVQTLFPPDNVKQVSLNDKFTLIPGQYNYDFAFQFPLWVQCANPNQFEGSHLAQDSLERTRFNSHKSRSKNTNHASHKLNPLPPTFEYRTSADTFCKIEYFLKLTVRRASKFALNTRIVIPLTFKLFDPDNEFIGFNDHETWIGGNEISLQTAPTAPGNSIPKKKGFFKKMFEDDSRNGSSFIGTNIPIQIFGDLRTPFAAQGSNIHMNLSLMTKLNPSIFKNKLTGKSNGLGAVYLERLRIYVSSVTEYLAQEFNDRRLDPSISLDLGKIARLDFADATPANMKSNDGFDLYRLDIPSNLLQDIPINHPNLHQTFQTCNINRFYYVFVEIQYTTTPNTGVVNGRSTLEIPLKVLSGIPTPHELRTNQNLNGKQRVNENYTHPSNGAPPMPARPPKQSSKADQVFQEAQQQQEQQQYTDGNYNENTGGPADHEEQLPSYSESTTFR